MKLADIYTSYMYSYPHKTAYGVLSASLVADYQRRLIETVDELYVHIPFCRSKCGYCNLFSVTGQSEETLQAYLSSCAIQMKQYEDQAAGARPLRFDSLTIGGGDPMILPPRLLDKALAIFAGRLVKSNIGKGNINIEASPNETTTEKLKILRDYHTGRVSIGIQSFNDDELKTLQRAHHAASARKALAGLKAMGFPCLNIDLIYGIPGQTLDSLAASLQETLGFAPEEIFIYPLYIRKGTGLSGKVINGQTYEMYLFAADYLLAAGYTQVSMRRFTKKSPDLFAGCGFENMLAIGCGGRSYLDNLHFCMPYAGGRDKCQDLINDFIRKEDKTEILNGYVLNEDELKRRFVIKNLLHCQGLFFEEYEGYFHTDLIADFPLVNQFMTNDYVEKHDQGIKLTALGLSLSDYLGPRFISAAVKAKMAGREAD